jgi:NADH dehydrogenase (ubiquinone) 1 alpha/beta subcomplex 1
MLLRASARAPAFAPVASSLRFSSISSSAALSSTFARRSDAITTFDYQRRHYGAAAGLSEADAKERVIKVVKNFHKVDPNAVTDKSHFINDLGLDSLDTVELVLGLEDEFCIEIPEEQADKIQTIEDAVSYLVTNPAAK